MANFDPAAMRSQLNALKEFGEVMQMAQALNGGGPSQGSSQAPPRRPPPGGNRPFNPNGNGDGIVCYHCQEAGHIARDCPKKKTPTPSTDVSQLAAAQNETNQLLARMLSSSQQQPPMQLQPAAPPTAAPLGPHGTFRLVHAS